MPRNKIVDLNNHLFEQLEKLNDDKLVGEHLDQELKRTKAMTDIAKNIIDSNRTVIQAMSVLQRAGVNVSKMETGVLDVPKG